MTRHQQKRAHVRYVLGPRHPGSSASGLCRAADRRLDSAASWTLGVLPNAALTAAVLFSKLSIRVYSTSRPSVRYTAAAFGA